MATIALLARKVGSSPFSRAMLALATGKPLAAGGPGHHKPGVVFPSLAKAGFSVGDVIDSSSRAALEISKHNSKKSRDARAAQALVEAQQRKDAMARKEAAESVRRRGARASVLGRGSGRGSTVLTSPSTGLTGDSGSAATTLGG